MAIMVLNILLNPRWGLPPQASLIFMLLSLYPTLEHMLHRTQTKVFLLLNFIWHSIDYSPALPHPFYSVQVYNIIR